MPPLKIALCDRQTLLRSALAQLLEGEEDIDVLWSVPSISEVFAQNLENAPHLLLIDFTAPTVAFLAEVHRFRSLCPDTQLIAMTDHGTDTCVLFKDVSATMSIGLPRTCCLQQAFMAGARGAVRKTSTREELMRVIRAVHAGQIAVEEPSLSLLLSRIFGRSQASASQPHLTQREQEVIRALALGKANKEIAVMLGIREQTVKNHISHILEKLGLEDRLQIVVFAARHHLISLESV